jgi:hypothetical protein
VSKRSQIIPFTADTVAHSADILRTIGAAILPAHLHGNLFAFAKWLVVQGLALLFSEVSFTHFASGMGT